MIAGSSDVGDLLGEVDSLDYQACKCDLVFSTSMPVESFHRAWDLREAHSGRVSS